MKKIKEFYKKYYSSEKSCEIMITVWGLYCIILGGYFIFSYIIKGKPILESLIASYFFLGYVLFITIQLITSILVSILLFILPSSLLWNLMVNIPDRKKIQGMNKEEQREYMLKELEKERIRHENRKINSINN